MTKWTGVTVAMLCATVHTAASGRAMSLGAQNSVVVLLHLEFRHRSVVASLLDLAGIAQAVQSTAQTASAPHYHFVSLMPQYRRFLEQAPEDPVAAAALFRQLVITPNQRVFNAVAADWMDDRDLQRFVVDLRAGSRSMRLVDSIFPQRFEAAWTDFARTFTDLRDNVTVYLIPAPSSAVGGAVRPFGAEDVMIFGAADVVTQMEAPSGFNTSVEHELTHLYQAHVNPEIRDVTADLFMNTGATQAARLYQVMWLEGFATWVSSKLNPAAADKEILRSQTISAEVRARWPALRDAILTHLDSTGQSDINAFVFSGSRAMDIPPRTGYYVGMRVADALGKRYTYAELTRLSGPVLRREFEVALRALRP